MIPTALLFFFTDSNFIYLNGIYVLDTYTDTKYAKHAPCTRMAHNLNDILIAINYNWPAYASIPILKKSYGEVFGEVVFCGNDEHEEFNQLIEIRLF